MWLIVPTSTGRTAASFRPEIGIDGIPTRVIVEHMTVIGPSVRLGAYAGRLPAADMRDGGAALQAAVALD